MLMMTANQSHSPYPGACPLSVQPGPRPDGPFEINRLFASAFIHRQLTLGYGSDRLQIGNLCGYLADTRPDAARLPVNHNEP